MDDLPPDDQIQGGETRARPYQQLAREAALMCFDARRQQQETYGHHLDATPYEVRDQAVLRILRTLYEGIEAAAPDLEERDFAFHAAIGQLLKTCLEMTPPVGWDDWWRPRT